MLFLVQNAADSMNAAFGPGLRRKVRRVWPAFRRTVVCVGISKANRTAAGT